MNKGMVLLVDDRPEFVQTLAERMAARGYEVVTALSGPQALQRLDERPFDALVLDVVMPEMDGIETLRRLRERHPDLAVIVLTGQGSTQEVIQALALGARDFLAKPTDLERLLERLDAAIAQRAKKAR